MWAKVGKFEMYVQRVTLGRHVGIIRGVNGSGTEVHLWWLCVTIG